MKAYGMQEEETAITWNPQYGIKPFNLKQEAK
jgi:hypothetical protein